uniref:Uncharacterized protein n=1 Tax=Anopheles melas TaxID=34690 RepID=A0A182TYZ1_9DIPT
MLNTILTHGSAPALTARIVTAGAFVSREGGKNPHSRTSLTFTTTISIAGPSVFVSCCIFASFGSCWSAWLRAALAAAFAAAAPAAPPPPPAFSTFCGFIDSIGSVCSTFAESMIGLRFS